MKSDLVNFFLIFLLSFLLISPNSPLLQFLRICEEIEGVDFSF